MLKLRLLGACFLSLSSVSALSAETARYQCEFHVFCEPDDGCRAASLQLEFVADTITNKAVLIGNNGVADVSFYQGDDATTFLEALKSGAIQSTTILNSGISVHSRHTIIGGELAQSQYSGQCEVTE